MSILPETLSPAKGASVTIAGRKVSWDAILVAGAGLLGVIFLYKAGQPSSIGSAAVAPADTTGGSFTSMPGAIPDTGLSTLASAVPLTSPPVATYSSFGPTYAPPGVYNAPPASTPAPSPSAAPPSSPAAASYAPASYPLLSFSPGGLFSGIVAAAQSAYAAQPAQPAPSSFSPSGLFGGIVAAAQRAAAAAPLSIPAAPSAPVYTPPAPVAQALPGGGNAMLSPS